MPPSLALLKLTPTQFNAELIRVSKELPQSSMRNFQRKIGGQALRSLVLKTPVDTGRARGNWQVDISQSPAGQVDITDKEGGDVIRTGIAKMNSVPAFGAIHIVNNLDYIEILEEGSSDQAPAGMLGITMQELANQFR